MSTTETVDTPTTKSDFLDHMREEFEQRLQEIKPQAEALSSEVQYIESTLEAWTRIEHGDNIFAKTETGMDRARKVSQQRTARTRKSGGGRGKVGDATMQALRDAGRPLSIPEIADSIGTHPNYLYRVMPKLEQEGLVEKVGKQFQAIGA